MGAAVWAAPIGHRHLGAHRLGAVTYGRRDKLAPKECNVGAILQACSNGTWGQMPGPNLFSALPKNLTNTT